MIDEIKICLGCSTAKHLNSEGFCGRCAKRRKVTYILSALQIKTSHGWDAPNLDDEDERNCEEAIEDVMALLKRERDYAYLDGKLEAYEAAELHGLVKLSHVEEWRVRIEQLRGELAKLEGE